jgi:leucyl/phenylalanyl-tRNA--protein transferase
MVAPLRARARDSRTEAVIALYRDGWFPMNDPDVDEVHWVQPNNRGIIPLERDRFVVSRSLRSAVRSNRFLITTNRAFSSVIRECAQPAKGRESTWLAPAIVELFDHLHAVSLAHSIEAWVCDPGTPPRLVGGLYGLAIGTVFCGESMFSRPALGGSNASKVCLVHLVHHLRRRGFTLLDAQMTNDHLERFGCFSMPREEYLAHVARSGDESPPWTPFEPERTIAELA